jgi:DNA-binding winged helix-turn-helix (wHTH) protein
VPVRFGYYEFDAARRRLSRQGTPVHLTPLAFTLLERLITGAPRVFTKQELHALLWPDSFVSDASLTSLIKELRRAMDDRDLITTVHGVGYRFDGEILPAPSSPPSKPHAVIHWVEYRDRKLRLQPGENLIGRAPDAEIWIDVGNISRRHATIVVTDGAAELHDLGSKNGTRANDRVLTGPTAIRDGDKIALGDVTLVYRCAAGGPPTESAVS